MKGRGRGRPAALDIERKELQAQKRKAVIDRQAEETKTSTIQRLLGTGGNARSQPSEPQVGILVLCLFGPRRTRLSEEDAAYCGRPSHTDSELGGWHDHLVHRGRRRHAGPPKTPVSATLCDY